LRVSVGLYNLLDRSYTQPGSDTTWQNAFEQDGRSIQFNLRYRF
jgi:outer membrane receptor protein involved in Fe transport